mgnify:CR=1 FL=1
MKQPAVFRRSYLIRSFIAVSCFAVAALLSGVVDPVAAISENTLLELDIPNVLALTADSSVEMNFTPTPGGTFMKKSTNVTVTTNNMTGYVLQVADQDSNTDLSHLLPTVSHRIQSISSNATESNFPTNSWGLSLDQTNFQAIPLNANPLTIAGTATGPVAGERKTVTFGAKVNADLTSGTYHDTVVFTAIANYVPTPTFSGITTMQQMTTGICNAETKPTKEATQSTTDHTEDTNLVPETTLTDTRDGKSYIIRKLADGNCWMSQNLALSPDGNTTYTEADTDLHDGRTFTAPAEAEDGSEWSLNGSDGPGYAIPYPGIAYIQNGTTPSSTGQPLEATGNFYNWPMATAGARDVNGNNLIYANSGEAADSICPKGWRLPPADGDKSYKNLLVSSYNLPTNSGAALLASPFNFLFAGWFGSENNDSNDYHDQGSGGVLIASTIHSGMNASANTIFIEEFFSNQWAAPFGRGFSVRCVAR